MSKLEIKATARTSTLHANFFRLAETLGLALAARGTALLPLTLGHNLAHHSFLPRCVGELPA